MKWRPGALDPPCPPFATPLRIAVGIVTISTEQGVVRQVSFETAATYSYFTGVQLLPRRLRLSRQLLYDVQLLSLINTTILNLPYPL